MAKRIVRLKEIIFRSGLTRSSIYKLAAEGKFPAPLNISERAVGWLESEFEDWLDSKHAAREEVRKRQR
ncbi:AlpA family phage regulatory protein [Mesorhizobium sp. M0317]|uniref:helix-turn-helix transcriptional regulator n=1 Tax=Mesorhizobium sp. M0317 TaxID=2956935 RepID=UPI00333D48F1